MARSAWLQFLHEVLPVGRPPGLLVANPSIEDGRKKAPIGLKEVWLRRFHLFTLIAGALLFGLLVYHIGAAALWREFLTLGWGLALLTVMDGAADLLHAQALRHCLIGDRKSLSLTRLLYIRMSGSAVNYLTPTAGFGGEITKGALLSADSMGTEAASAVIIDKLSLALGQLLFVIVGCIFFLPRHSLPAGLWFALISGTGLLAAGMVAFLVLQWKGKLGSIVRWAVAHRVGGRSLKKAAGSMTQVDEVLRLFYKSRPLDLPLSIFWHGVGMAWGIIPAYVFLILLTGHASFSTAGAVVVLGTWFNLVTFALPVDIGVQEATRVVALRLLGYSSALGLTYGITIRIEQLLWAGLGLLMYALLLSRINGKARGVSAPQVKDGGQVEGTWTDRGSLQDDGGEHLSCNTGGRSRL